MRILAENIPQPSLLIDLMGEHGNLEGFLRWGEHITSVKDRAAELPIDELTVLSDEWFSAYADTTIRRRGRLSRCTRKMLKHLTYEEAAAFLGVDATSVVYAASGCKHGPETAARLLACLEEIRRDETFTFEQAAAKYNLPVSAVSSHAALVRARVTVKSKYPPEFRTRAVQLRQQGLTLRQIGATLAEEFPDIDVKWTSIDSFFRKDRQS